MVSLRRLEDLVALAIRGQLSARHTVVLRSALAGLCLVGLMAGLARPASASACVLFPLLLTSFFEGHRVGCGVGLLLLLALGLGPMESPDLVLAASLCLLSVLLARLASSKYRQVFCQVANCATRLEIARAVQRSLEPPSCVTIGPLRIHTRIEVCHDLGGDFVGLRGLADGGVLVLVGDVQGKGPQSALTAAYIEGVFHHCCMAGVDIPEKVLENLHQLLQSKDGNRFVTAMCLRFCSEGRRVRVANAGHPLPIIVSERPRMTGETGLVLGLSMLFEVGVTELELEAGERLLLLSDGCYEDDCISPPLAHVLSRRGAGMDDILGWVSRTACQHIDDRTMVLIEKA